jgi:hypothetical protein
MGTKTPTIEWFDGDRDELADLFALADDSPTAVMAYQLLGFRMLRVERDAFTPATGYAEIEVDGIALRDRIWLSLTL